MRPARRWSAVDELWRALPHDLSNALAASATALEGGGHPEGVRGALRAFRGLPHRVELVGSWAGVSWYDDSKATAPHATLAAVRGLRPRSCSSPGAATRASTSRVLAQAAPHLRSVVAIGEAADEVAAAFFGLRPVTVAASMAEAVALAGEQARAGDVVLLSPGCASFDWYAGYDDRGDDFAGLVRRRHDAGTSR